jgi:hypothetical protein
LIGVTQTSEVAGSEAPSEAPGSEAPGSEVAVSEVAVSEVAGSEVAGSEVARSEAGGGATGREAAESEATASTSGELIRTLYVIGFPTDILYREVFNLFRFFLGFAKCTLKNARGFPTVFVTFDSHENASAVMTKLQGLQYDPDTPTPLKIELAKSNTAIARG